MPGPNPITPTSPASGPDLRASRATRAMETGESFARRLLCPLRARVSLASGSVLVLLTLLLPIGYESCGPKTRGFELIGGNGAWPSFVGIMLPNYLGRAFYGAALALAAWTALFVLISLGKSALLRNRSLCRTLLLISGTLSLFLLSDVMALLPMAADNYGCIGGALIIISCLMPGKFWPRKIFWRWISILALAILFVLGLTAMKWIQGDASPWFVLGIWAIYALGPLGLWWAHASGRRDFGSKWEDIRRGHVAFYVPAAMGHLWFFVIVWREGIWGFVPCALGIHLMALGYLRLAKEADLPHAANKPPDGS